MSTTFRTLMRVFALLAMPAAALLAFQPNRAEFFDTSGMPKQPTNFLEQQIFARIAAHIAGDLSDAAMIQRKLGKYYADKGDERRSEAAFLRAADAENPPKPAPAIIETAPKAPPRTETPAPAAYPKNPITGNYYGYEERTLHTWEFHADGTFLHTWIASGAGTSVRNSERGAYSLAGDTLELKIASAASAFATPGAGSRTTLLGGGAAQSAEIRRVKLRFDSGGVTLDGVRLKPKSW